MHSRVPAELDSDAALQTHQPGNMVAASEEIFFGQGGLLRSGFGKQTLGRDPSAPSFGFGSSNRDAGLKLYASADHDKAKVRSSGGNQSQGAVYKVEVCTAVT